MAECLVTQKSNCKNCYKCIRHCPVKSIRFTDGQAHIIRDECILCGECYIVCPQDAKQIRKDSDIVKELVLQNEVYVSLAPSYAGWFLESTMSDMEDALKKLGFAGVFGTAIGAEVVKKRYEEIINNNENNVIISSCCHTVNKLIERHFSSAVKYLAKVATPMHTHAALLKKEHPEAKVVFVGPCISKKSEAEEFGVVDAVLTFEELEEWLLEEGISVSKSGKVTDAHRTDAFAVSGGILKSMNFKEDFNYIVIDGVENCINALKDIDNKKLKNCFIEMSACAGSCVGGPVMRKKSGNLIMNRISVEEGYGEKTYDLALDISTDRSFNFEGASKAMPGGAAIDEILKKMGKPTPEQELNCGSCGYNTCREKAAAVLMGKADLSMCMPYLKEKAESFSDNIIRNTPNGIIVLDDALNVQQINNAARKILNLKISDDIIGSPVVRILDPIDYVLTLSEEKNIYDKQKYLAEYQRYVEETVIYDREYHIIMIIMKDITDEENMKNSRDAQCRSAVEITDKIVEKQMRVVQEIASLLGETTAETKIALTKLKETLRDE